MLEEFEKNSARCSAVGTSNNNNSKDKIVILVLMYRPDPACPARSEHGQGKRGPTPKRGAPQGPHRLVARTSRYGRDNPGSTPGADM